MGETPQLLFGEADVVEREKGLWDEQETQGEIVCGDLFEGLILLCWLNVMRVDFEQITDNSAEYQDDN